MKKRSDNVRKAAILIASLDRDAADALLNQMSDEQARRLRRALVELGDVEPDEQAEVIEEFFRIGPMAPEKFPAGVELCDTLAEELGFGASGGSLATPRESVEPGTASFRFLEVLSAAELAGYLEREHPQTIALVVSHLTAQRAGDVLGRLSPLVQAEVARRLVDLDPAQPEVIREVERGLENSMAAEVRSRERRQAGLATLEGILQAADDRTQQEILANLDAVDRQLAGKLGAPRRRPLSFAELQRWDDRALAAVLERADTEIAVLALAGANHDFVERLLAILPRAQARALRYALDHLGPTKLSDLETGQDELAALAEAMQSSGELKRETARRLSLAA
jgi:flagellar motor switch protein FliG